MAAIIVERPSEPVGKRNARVPTGERTKSAVVGEKVAYIDALAFGRKRPDFVFPAVIGRNDRLGQRRQATRLVTAHIKSQPLGLFGDGGMEERLGSIVNVKQIPTLLASPYLEWF